MKRFGLEVDLLQERADWRSAFEHTRRGRKLIKMTITHVSTISSHIVTVPVQKNPHKNGLFEYLVPYVGGYFTYESALKADFSKGYGDEGGVFSYTEK